MNNKQKNRKTKKNGGGKTKHKNKKENSPHYVATEYIKEIMLPYKTIRPDSKTKKRRSKSKSKSL